MGQPGKLWRANNEYSCGTEAAALGRPETQAYETTILDFLKWLRRRYRSGEVLHVVLDNASYHKKAEILEYAATHKIRFYFTPTSASWLNRIECHFAALRKFALEGTDYRTHEEQQAAIDRYLAWRAIARVKSASKAGSRTVVLIRRLPECYYESRSSVTGDDSRCPPICVIGYG